MTRARIASVVIALVFSGLVAPPILINVLTYSSLSCDMLHFHLPQINFFIKHPWNLIDYPGYSVSLPGHHVLLAWIARAMGYTAIDSTTMPIRLVHATFGLAFSLILFRFLYRLRRDDPHQSRLWVTLALWISVVPSFYILQSSIYISTDIPAATIYLVFLYLTTFHSQAIAPNTLSGTALVFWRQSYAPVLLTPFLVNAGRVRMTQIGPLLLTLAVPGMLLFFYIVEFGGLVPRNSIVEPLPEPWIQIGWLDIFPQSILHVFAYLGLISPIYLTIFGANIRTAYRLRSTIIVASIMFLLIALIWVAVPSTGDYVAGRWGSVVWIFDWTALSWGDNSLLVLLLGIVGAAFLAVLMHLAVSCHEIRSIFLGMLLYLAGQIFQPLAYQRYIEPVTLTSLALIAAPSVVVATWRVSLFALIFALYSLAGLLRIYSIHPDICS